MKKVAVVWLSSFLASVLAQFAFIYVWKIDYVPETGPRVKAALALAYAAAGVLVLLRLRSAGLRVALIAYWLLTGSMFAVVASFEFFPDELMETKSWPDAPRSTAYIYTDSFREKMAIVKLRNGSLPVMASVGWCRWGNGYSVGREGNDFVYRCDGAEKRIPLAGVQSKPSE